jgi:benzoylformate decarboxylase
MTSLPPALAMLAILRDEGVDRIFGNPGTTELPFLDALVDAPDLRYVLGLQEGSVVAMADGYARATGRPAFVNLHVAPGLANGLSSLNNARHSRTPLVVTAGQQDRRHLRTDPMLAGDLVALAAGVTKSATEVHQAYDLPLVLRRAFAEAVRPPAGPVFVSVPMDLLAEEAPVEVPARSARPEPAVAAGVPAAARRLAAARRPAIIAGDGVGREQAIAELVAVAEALGAAVYQQPMADAVSFPGHHPLYQGMPPPNRTALRDRLAGHDVVLIAGARAFTAHHYSPDQPIPPGTEVIALDADPAEPGRDFPVSAALVGGVRVTLGALAEALGGAVPGAAERARDLAAASARTWAEVDARAQARHGAAPMDPLGAVHALAGALPAGTIVVEEAITSGVLLRQVLRPDRAGALHHTIGGGLGWGIGAAIGTRLGSPDRPVVAVLGDGSAMFGLQGLWTAAHDRVPVTFVIMDNGEYRTLKDTLDRNKSRSTAAGRYIGLDLREPRLDWAGAGQLFGIPVARPAGCAELAEVIAGAADRDGPLLVQVAITGHRG